jgi:hypothetical protein
MAIIRKRAVARTLDHITGDGAWVGNNAEIAKARWFLKRCKKRDKKVKLERESRKRNRK